MGFSVMAVLLNAATLLSPSADGPVGIPFTVHRDHLLVVRGSIGELRDLVFILDTGAGRTIVSPSLAASLGLRGPSSSLTSFGTRLEAEEIEIPSLELGRHQAGRLDVLVTPLDSAAKALGIDRLDGLIGVDVLRRRSFLIDFRTRTLWIGALRPAPYTAAILDDPVFLRVRADVDGRPVNLIVDSGASHLVLFEAHRTPDGRPAQQGAHMAGITAVHTARVGQIRVGKWGRRALDVVIVSKGPDEAVLADGLLSLRWLDAEFVQFDVDRQELGWRY